MKNKRWTRKELILAFNLYLKLPFGKMHRSNPEVIHLANIIERTPSAVAMRLTNFAHIDPYHQSRGIKGLSGGKNQVAPIWDEFVNNKEELLYKSEEILAEYEGNTVEQKYSEELIGTENLKGEEKFREVKARVNQNIFRQIVLANYSSKCAISGIDISDLLVASHIIPWSKNENERLNPENGICLSALYDKAYDKGYIAISDEYKILLSSELKERRKELYYSNFFECVEGSKINLPDRYLPKPEFLQYHLDTIFKG